MPVLRMWRIIGLSWFRAPVSFLMTSNNGLKVKPDVINDINWLIMPRDLMKVLNFSC
jgi:hypothetical protein